MENNASQARADAHMCIVQALKYLSVFLFDHLVPLKPVKFLEGKLIHDLLNIFVSGKWHHMSSFIRIIKTSLIHLVSFGVYSLLGYKERWEHAVLELSCTVKSNK